MNTRTIRDRVITMIPALLLTTMISGLLLRVTLLPESFGLILGVAILSFVLLYFATLNWKTILISLLSLGAAVGLTWLILGREGQPDTIDYIRQCIGYFETMDPVSTGQTTILMMSIIFSSAIVCFTFGWRVPIFPVILTIALGGVIVFWELGNENILFYLSGIVLSLVVMYAVAFQGFLKRRHKTETNRSGTTFWSIPVALLIVIMGFVSSPHPFDDMSRWFYRTTNEVNDFLADYTGFTSGRTYYTVGAWGLMPLGERMGGPVELSDVDIFRVDSEEPHLLRAEIYNNYTGQTWTDTLQANRYRFNHRKWTTLQGDTFDTIRPNMDMESMPENLMMEITLHIKPLRNMTSSIFTPFRVDNVVPDRFISMVPYFNNQGEVFSARNIDEDVGYTIESTILDYEHKEFTQHLHDLQSEIALDSPEKIAEIYEHYMNLPDNLPQDVVLTAIELTEDVDGDWNKVLVLQHYLKNNFRYTLRPASPPDDVDFVAYFLETGEGYCTYYASAMAVMSRIAGIPSRYVEGYAMPEQKRNGYYVVTGRHAHTWVEVYLDGIGWIPVDATGSSTTTGDAGAVDLNDYMDTYMDPFDQPMDIEPDEFMPVENVVADRSAVAEIAKRITWIVGILLLIYYFIGNPTYKAISCSLWIVSRRYTDPVRIMEFYYQDILRLLMYYNVHFAEGNTLQGFAKKVDQWLRTESGMHFRDVAEVVSQVSYNHKPVSAEDVQTMVQFRRTLARTTKRTMGGFRYYLAEGLGWKIKRKR